jgi:hypothetical protein
MPNLECYFPVCFLNYRPSKRRDVIKQLRNGTCEWKPLKSEQVIFRLNVRNDVSVGWMLKKSSFILVLALCFASVFTIFRAGPGAADSGSSWSKTYDGGGLDKACLVVQTSDGGYVLAGYTQSLFPVKSNLWLVKTDSLGDMQWNKTLSSDNDDLARAMVKTSDGGFAIAGETTYEDKTDFLLVKTDGSGNMQWRKTFGSENGASAFALIQTSDGGYALAGRAQPSDVWSLCSWIVKTDSSGSMQWSKMFENGSDTPARSIIQTRDGGYIVAGETDFYGSSFHSLLLKMDNSGNVEWTKTIGSGSINAAIQTSDGGYALAGYTQPSDVNGNYFWLVKTDSSGDNEWSKSFPGNGWDFANSVIQTSDGGYVLAGGAYPLGSEQSDFGFMKTDSSGNKEWGWGVGGAYWDQANSVIQASDGGYAIAGYVSYDAAPINSDFWLIKTDSAGNVEELQVPEGEATPTEFPILIITSAVIVCAAVMGLALFLKKRGGMSETKLPLGS